jgi:hypothetical protein
MLKIIHGRLVPDPLHRTLKARAALAGLRLSEYLIAEWTHGAERLPVEEIRERLACLKPVAVTDGPADAVRVEREGRDGR